MPALSYGDIVNLLSGKSDEYRQGFFDAVNLNEKTKCAFLQSVHPSVPFCVAIDGQNLIARYDRERGKDNR